MAVRKPLVLVGGEIAQLPVGDTLSGPFGEVDTVALTNGDATSHLIGEAVYISAADTGKRAKADAAATKHVVAFAMATITAGSSGSYQTGGILAGLTGLTTGSVYYLSAATAGLITVTAPTTVGQFVVRVGIAISTTELKIEIEPAISL